MRPAPHPGSREPRAATRGHLTLEGPGLRARPARTGDAAALQECLEGAPAYWERTDGGPPPPDAAERLLEDAGADPSRRVYLLAPGGGGLVAGLLDLHLDHPEPGVAHVGLLLLRESCQGRGHGGETVAALVRALAGAGYRAVRASVGDENPEAKGFWDRMGFAEAERLDRGVTVYERVIG